MKKKLALVLAAALMVASFAGCTSKPAESVAPAESAAAAESAAPAPAPASDLKVGVFYYNFADVYITTVRTAMDAKLDALGVDYDNYDGNTNQPQQIDQINTAISNGVNLLIVNIVETSSPDSAQMACDAAKAAGIPIIFFNREVDNSVIDSYDMAAFVGTNAPEAGHLQGQMIADFLLENYDAVDLNGDGKITYAMFKGQEGNAEAEYRTQFAVEDCDTALKDAGKPALEYYDSRNTSKYQVDQTGGWSSQAATDYMTTILAEYTEANNNMVELIIANNDGMAEGAVSALQTAGYNKGTDDASSKTIPVFGVDAVDTAVQKIEKGQMTGTVKQDGDKMAETIVTLVGNVSTGAALMDNTADFNVDTDCAKIRVPYATFTGK